MEISSFADSSRIIRLTWKQMRYQFRLRTILIVVAIFCCILAIWKALPLDAKQFTICSSAVATLSSLVFVLLTRMNQFLAIKALPNSSATGSIALVSICLTATMIVLLAFWMQLPFRTGTAQLAIGNPQYMFVLNLRTAVTLSVLVAPFFCVALQKLIVRKKDPSPHIWMLIGIVSFIVALNVVVKSGFMPMV